MKQQSEMDTNFKKCLITNNKFLLIKYIKIKHTTYLIIFQPFNTLSTVKMRPYIMFIRFIIQVTYHFVCDNCPQCG